MDGVAVSAENVELVRRWFAGLQGGDPSPDLCHPEILIRNRDQSPIRGPYHGRQGLGQWWADFADEVDGPFGAVVTVRDGKILSAIGYASPGRAKKAAGLRKPETECS